MQKGFSRILLLFAAISILIITVGVYWGYLEYQKNLKATKENQQLIEDKKSREIPESQTEDTKETATTNIKIQSFSKTFSSPYYISWRENFSGYSISYDLTKITAGEKTLDNLNSYGLKFKEGDKINSLTLYFKINKIGKTGSGVCPNIGLRMELNEEGDLAAPLNSSFNAHCFWDNQTYFDQEAIFSVPATQRKFIILTKNQSNLIFTITLLENGDIRLEKNPSSEYYIDQTIKKPDLTIESVYFAPTNPKVGDTINIDIKIKNIGDKASSYSSVSAMDQRGWGQTTSVKNLNPGEEKVVNLVIFANVLHLDHNPHVFNVKIDSNNNVYESNEGNNSKTVTISVSSNEQLLE